MNSTTMAPRAGGVPELAVDIASASSRLFWLVRSTVAGGAAMLQLPGAVYTRFSDAVAARSRIDSTPPLTEHPAGVCRLNDDVVVDGVGPGKVNWIHPTGDVRVELARRPGSAEYYPVSAIRRAVANRPRFEFEVVPVGLREANEVVERLHRRLGQVQGHKFALGLRREEDQDLVGVAVCARPVARHLDDGLTAEVRRVAVDPAVTNGCTKLLGAIAKSASAMGYRRLVTYTSEDETGASLYAAGWDPVGKSAGGHWGSAARPRRRGEDEGRKVVWVKVLRGEERGR
ncbi:MULTISPECIES: XF1762 family protein [Piscinibacter]|uniref:XF1762 family protein n=1 Tax=Piscinibacter TaxID=1114981 RepID=UPI000FDEF251|nr:XF1762 family protein [Piscinibacter defluvii]